MSEALLSADGLALRAGGSARGRILVDRLDIRVDSGERWVVVGPNGAGKSSLLAGLAGVFPLYALCFYLPELPWDKWRDALRARIKKQQDGHESPS